MAKAGTEYTCAICGGIFLRDRDDDESMAEHEVRDAAGFYVPYGHGELEIVCEDCFVKVKSEMGH